MIIFKSSNLVSTYTDVLAVVVDVLLWSTTMLQNVIVVTVVNDKNTAWLQHASKVLEALFMIPNHNPKRSINQSSFEIPEIPRDHQEDEEMNFPCKEQHQIHQLVS